MAKFYLANPKSEKSSVYVRVYFGNPRKELKYYFGLSVVPKYWNAKKQIFEGGSKYPIRLSLNSFLSTANAKIKKLLISYSDNLQNPNREQVKNDLDRLFGVVNNSDSKDEIPNFVDFCYNSLPTLPISERSKIGYTTGINALRSYERKYKIVLTFQNVNLDFYYNYIHYLTYVYKTPKGERLRPKTIGARIKVVKRFLSHAHNLNYDVCQDYTKKAFKKPNDETRQVYLTDNELDDIILLSGLPPRLEKVRDLFVIQCETGLRYSDVTRITKANITAKDILKITTQKTKTEVAIPLSNIVKFFLEKYDYQIPTTTNQQYNNDIKEICRLAGIDTPILLEYTKGGKQVSETQPKYKLIASHTARRTFSTRLANNDSISDLQLMKMTGHKNVRTLHGYVKTSVEDNAITLKENPAFNRAIPQLNKEGKKVFKNPFLRIAK